MIRNVTITCLLLLGGCPGREIVDIWPVPPPAAPTCDTIPSCPDDFEEFDPLPEHLDEFITVSCPDQQVCAAETESGDWRGCALEGPVRFEESTELRGVDLTCASIEIELAEGVTLSLRDATLADTELYVTGTGASTLILSRAQITNSNIVISGEAYLDVVEGNLTEAMIDVRDSSGPVVQLTNSVAQTLFLVGGPRAELHVDHGHLGGLWGSIGRFLSDSASLAELRLSTDELILADVTMGGGRIKAERSTIISSEIDGSSFFGCTELSLVKTALRHSFIDACEEQLVVEEGSVVRNSVVRGPLVTRRSNWSQTVFANETIVAEESSQIRSAALCGVRYILSIGAAWHCATCMPEPEEICASGTRATPECPALELAPECT